jgi:hypothetical protein
MTASSLMPPEMVGWIQLFFIIVGHIYGIIAAVKISRNIFGESKKASLALLPQIILLILFSEFSILLIAQTMDMRTPL